MIIVDDRLCLDVLAGRFGAGRDGVATTWGFHYRLVRALADDSRVGALTSVDVSAIRSVAANPAPDRLTVLDPRDATADAAAVGVRHGLNLLAAELVAAAVRNDAVVHLSPGNVGRGWREVFDAEGVVLRVQGE